MNIIRLSIFTGLVACGFAPTEGAWEGKNFDLSSDGCTAAALYGVTDESTILNFTYASTDTGFSLTGDTEDAVPIECTRTEKDFDCPLTAEFDFTDGLGDFPAFDAVISFTGTLSGTFSDANTATTTSEIGGVCEGAACVGVVDAVNTENGTTVEMPCSSSIPFDIEAKSE